MKKLNQNFKRDKSFVEVHCTNEVLEKKDDQFVNAGLVLHILVLNVNWKGSKF